MIQAGRHVERLPADGDGAVRLHGVENFRALDVDAGAVRVLGQLEAAVGGYNPSAQRRARSGAEVVGAVVARHHGAPDDVVGLTVHGAGRLPNPAQVEVRRLIAEEGVGDLRVHHERGVGQRRVHGVRPLREQGQTRILEARVDVVGTEGEIEASVRSVTYAWRTMNSGSITVTSPNRRSTAVSGTATCAPIWASLTSAHARRYVRRSTRRARPWQRNPSASNNSIRNLW